MKKSLIVLLVAISAMLCLKGFYIPDKLNAKKYIDKISEYIRLEEEKSNKDEFTKCFNNVKVFGSVKNYIYSWVDSGCYSIENGKLESKTGFSMAMKFKIEKGEVKSYITPKDGNLYKKSMNELFPKAVVAKMYKYDEVNSYEVVNKAIKYFNIYKVDNINISENKNGKKEVGTIADRKIIADNVDVLINGEKLNEVIKRYDIVPALRDYLNIESTFKNVEILIARDGGSTEYRNELENYKVVICNKIDGNHNIYFGNKDMKFEC